MSPPRTNRNNTQRPSQNPQKSSNYKGRKNALGSDRIPLKCHKCRCSHTENCNCPCVYHFADKCPGPVVIKKTSEEPSKDKLKSQLGLFLESNVFSKDSKTFYVEEDSDDVVLVIKETLEELVLISIEKSAALIDCACPSTVSGKRWVLEFFNMLSDEERSNVEMFESEKIYKFGGGEKRRSLGRVVFPCFFAGMNLKITTEVVDAEFPLLLGNTMLKKAKAVLYFAEGKALVMGNEMPMTETDSGHFSLPIEPPREKDMSTKDERLVVSFLTLSEEPLSLADVQKLHHYFGHIPKRRLENLINKSNKLTAEVKQHLEHVELHCKSCKMNQKAKPLPAVALPRASRFNEVVTIDLKHYPDGKYCYILYLIDFFSRLTVGALIGDKNPSTVAQIILSKWIASMGRMDTLHSDRGGEFNCEELTAVAEYIGVKCTLTAAYSPHQNGLNERNHAICDGMITKMRMEDPTLSAEVALTWALVAKNSLENYSGFSPFQLVFGESPKLPSVYTAGPPGLEEVVMNKCVADHINALHLAREAYISGESDRVIKAALKQRIYKRGNDIKQGDWIYYKNNGKWQGPIKVCGKDGKSLYAIRAGKLLTINSDHADIAMFEGEFLGKKHDPESTAGIAPKRNVGENEGVSESFVYAGQNRDMTGVLENTNNINLDNDKEVIDDIESNKEIVEKNDSKVVHKGDLLRYKKSPDSEWNEGKVISRAGKASGKYSSWWNIKNLQTGHIQAEDISSFDEIQEIPDGETEDAETETFVMNIPRQLHNERRCIEAKEKELKSWDNFDVYEEILDEGQPRIATNWVLKEKIIDGVSGVKARLTVRGDQEETGDIRKDSPTVRRGNVKIFCAVAAKEGWNMKSIDGTSAFLQGTPIEREVFILPPRERRVPGMIWKLKKPVYGLKDAARGWHLALDNKLQEAGCDKCFVDPAMYLNFEAVNEKKHIQGIVLSHVDDLLYGGNKHFDKSVMQAVRASFEFSEEESEKFRYIGMNMVQNSNGISIDQDHYIKSLELPELNVANDSVGDELLDEEGQKEFRGSVAKLLYVGCQSRPDVCFEGKCLSSKFGKASKKDLKSAYRKMQKLKGEETCMFFPDLGETTEWSLIGYSDAGIKSMPDKLTSVGGQVVLLVNEKKQLACVLNWRSKKLVRKVVSSLAGEALAMVALIGELVYNKTILVQLFGEGMETIPVICFTDCKNLHDAIHSTSLVEDSWLVPDIAIIQEALTQQTISAVRRVSSKDMLADCLTKAGASAERLMHVLRTGHYICPLDISKKKNQKFN